MHGPDAEAWSQLQLDPSAAEPVGEETGLSSRLWRVGDCLVKHAHRPEDAAREADFYTRWAPLTGLPLPRLRQRHGDWLVLDWIDGAPGDCLVGADAARADSVAAALRAIAGVARGSAPPPGLRRLLPEPAALADRARSGLPHFHRHFPGFSALVDDLPARSASAAAHLAQAPGALCHADLHVENVLFQGDQAIIIDWQTVAWAPTGIDVARFAVEGLADPTDWHRWAPHAVAQVPWAVEILLCGLVASRWLKDEALTPRAHALFERSLTAMEIVLG